MSGRDERLLKTRNVATSPKFLQDRRNKNGTAFAEGWGCAYFAFAEGGGVMTSVKPHKFIRYAFVLMVGSHLHLVILSLFNAGSISNISL